MSYDIHLNDPVTKQTIELENPHFMRGDTYAIDGTKELSLNITYNYKNECCFVDASQNHHTKINAERFHGKIRIVDALVCRPENLYQSSREHFRDN